ncbi:hypothetical protein ACOQFV_27395 [Nocardiopsis changdeensis]|uniref:Uncharacterized protein n=1 Tax=Nocardiopsis changdeensis TaxID=2831969 RepID=A0ABX8BP08_9ACTN|nr:MULTISPECIES: hypothetical protein [Nocardiopsis]QUX22994.1 hypothetical protein KGD84_00855 [Nocardiopsis changdeensis]QYX38937.1 hypothetical protein K1J57_10305 [Nocardiopsis sp. MT53]
MIRSTTWDADTERHVPTDHLCPCGGTPCPACQVGSICQVSGRDYTDQDPSGAAWWDPTEEWDYED